MFSTMLASPILIFFKVLLLLIDVNFQSILYGHQQYHKDVVPFSYSKILFCAPLPATRRYGISPSHSYHLASCHKDHSGVTSSTADCTCTSIHSFSMRSTLSICHCKFDYAVLDRVHFHNRGRLWYYGLCLQYHRTAQSHICCLGVDGLPYLGGNIRSSESSHEGLS